MANDNVSAVLAMKGGSGGGGGSGTDSNAVHYSADSNKTDAERAAALDNVGGEPKKLIVTVTESGGVFSADKTHAQIKAAYDAGKTVEAVSGDYIFRMVSCYDAGANFIFLEDNNSDQCVFEAGLAVTFANAWTHTARTLIPAPTTVTDLSSTSITLTASANTYYTYGELTALTISSFPASGTFWIVFESGSTPTTTTGISNFAAEANKRYKLTIENGYATFEAWTIGGGS